MKVPKIRNDRDLYRAMSDYSSRVWEWHAHLDEDFETEPAPEELIQLLKDRIDWVRDHEAAVNRYLLKRNRAMWYKVIDGSGEAGND